MRFKDCLFWICQGTKKQRLTLRECRKREFTVRCEWKPSSHDLASLLYLKLSMRWEATTPTNFFIQQSALSLYLSLSLLKQFWLTEFVGPTLHWILYFANSTQKETMFNEKSPGISVANLVNALRNCDLCKII